ncbi:MAG: hypothetical protein NUV63_04005, partial [Gallionella sp.]|nr:hypothetical protein [Gallionella sp.]
MSEYLHVEKPFLDQLATLGWNVVDQGVGIIPFDPASSLRTSFREWLLPDVFRSAMRAINTTEGGKQWLTDRQLDELHRTALKAAVAVAVILTLAVWVGDALLSFFGIGIPAFRIGGGLLVLIIAIAMFDARISPARHTDAEQAEAEAKNDIAVVPL